jgi:multicomponent Na+:H+ antiporter subunit G
MIYRLLLMVSWVYIIFGTIGVFRFSNLYSRLLVSSKIDTAAMITIILALIVKLGFDKLSLKLLLILLFLLVTIPISNHVITRSALLNGIPVKSEVDQ